MIRTLKELTFLGKKSGMDEHRLNQFLECVAALITEKMLKEGEKSGK